MTKRVGPGVNVDIGQRQPSRENLRKKKSGAKFRKLLVREPERKEGSVKLSQRPLSWRIEKDYGSYVLWYGSNHTTFRKRNNGSDCFAKPSAEEIMRFKKDVAEAAINNRQIANIIVGCPDLQQ